MRIFKKYFEKNTNFSQFYYEKNYPPQIMIQASTLDFVASHYKILIINVLMKIWNENF